MASAISLEYLQSIEGQANGLATLDGSGKIPVSQIPSAALDGYLGEYPTQLDLTTAYPTASLANYAYVAAASSFWHWNPALSAPAWVNQKITAVAYTALSAEEKAPVPYVIVP